MSVALHINSHMRPDVRAESVALAIMEEAFDPRFGEAWTARQLTGFTCLPGVRLDIARLGGADIGFALTRLVLDETELLLLAVRPGWRGRGVGRHLVQNCLDAARRSGALSVHLEVRANNPAVQFYDSLGFENVHTRPNYYRGDDGTTYDALSYRIDTL